MQELLIALPVLLLSMVAHEYAHGFAALREGDPTALVLGRLTFNPVRHIDPFMTVLLPLLMFAATGGRVIFGGAKPVPVNPRNYRHYRRGDLIVSSAGIAVNLALFVVCALVTVAIGVVGRAVGPAGLLVLLQRMVAWGIWLNVLLAFFNLIPIPPLDGSHILYQLLPARLGTQYRQLGRYGAAILLLILLLKPEVLGALLTPAYFLQHAACGAVQPWALAPIRACSL